MPMIWAMMTVKKMRSSTAAPAPSRMPQKRCFGGSERQASAMTTALSPDSRMLIQMICPTATQNATCIISAQRWLTEVPFLVSPRRLAGPLQDRSPGTVFILVYF